MRIFFKLAIVCFLIMMPRNCLCNVSPFGLELNKATIKDFLSKYDVMDIIKKPNQQTIISVSPKLLDLSGLKTSVCIFDHQDILQSVILTMDKSHFDEMYKILSQKYKIDEKLVPFVGDKYVSFFHKYSFIRINTPHLGFDLKIIYVNKLYFKKYQDDQEKLEKSEREKKKAVL